MAKDGRIFEVHACPLGTAKYAAKILVDDDGPPVTASDIPYALNSIEAVQAVDSPKFRVEDLPKPYTRVVVTGTDGTLYCVAAGLRLFSVEALRDPKWAALRPEVRT